VASYIETPASSATAKPSRDVTVDTATPLRAIRVTLAHAFYGQDPAIQFLDTLDGRRPIGPRHVLADSVPFLFDTSATHAFPNGVAWQQSQQEVLARLVSAIAGLPPASLVQGCHYVSDAVRALTRTDIPAALRPAAHTLQTTLALPPACRHH
jgi:hypothetical protein